MVFTTLLFIKNQIINTVNLTIRLFTYFFTWICSADPDHLNVDPPNLKSWKYSAALLELSGIWPKWSNMVQLNIFLLIDVSKSLLSSLIYIYLSDLHVFIILYHNFFLFSNIYMFFFTSKLRLRLWKKRYI